MKVRQLPYSAYLKGIATILPAFNRLACRHTGGTMSARYCMAVWFRHWAKIIKHVSPNWTPRVLAELGPGDSIGIGLCAMLCGIDHYRAFDVKAYGGNPEWTRILLELSQLLLKDEPIPGYEEFPNISPELDKDFRPSDLLPTGSGGFFDRRQEAIQRALLDQDEQCSVRYVAPWTESQLGTAGEEVDLIISQAVLEHVDDLPMAYRSMSKALRPGGMMSHTIDFKCHGITRDWFGHWTVNDSQWAFARGNRPYFINRMPWSYHRRMIEENGFQILSIEPRSAEPPPRLTLAPFFRSLLENDDLATSGVYVLAKRSET